MILFAKRSGQTSRIRSFLPTTRPALRTSAKRRSRFRSEGYDLAFARQHPFPPGPSGTTRIRSGRILMQRMAQDGRGCCVEVGVIAGYDAATVDGSGLRALTWNASGETPPGRASRYFRKDRSRAAQAVDAAVDVLRKLTGERSGRSASSRDESREYLGPRKRTHLKRNG